MFGREEIEEIIPAVNAAKALGLDVDGPIPPDTVFPKLNGKLYDICVCMYHDQGHIPTKLLGFTWNEQEGKWNSVSGVNITMGLPIIRVSVDHGTAYDIAGRVASERSLVSAIEYAVQLAKTANEETQRGADGMELCRGIIPAILTPLQPATSIFGIVPARAANAGCRGARIFCLGTNGEFYALSEEEKYQVVEAG